jgi:hypothetical protein
MRLIYGSVECQTPNTDDASLHVIKSLAALQH